MSITVSIGEQEIADEIGTDPDFLAAILHRLARDWPAGDERDDLIEDVVSAMSTDGVELVRALAAALPEDAA